MPERSGLANVPSPGVTGAIYTAYDDGSLGDKGRPCKGGTLYELRWMVLVAL
jgi:hypothetical protein